MHIWMVNATDAIPGEDFGYKRGADVAAVLSRAGHSVDWLVPSFAHACKEQRPARLEVDSPGARVVVHSVPTCAYEANVSVARIRSYWQFGRGLLAIAPKLRKPDAILAVLPTPFADVACGRLAQQFGVPLIGDFRDLWPELFAAHVPTPLEAVSPVLLAPWYAMRRYALRRLSHLVSVNERYREHLLEQEPALRMIPSSVIYDGIDARIVSHATPHDSVRASGLTKPDGTVWAIYAGMLSDHHDIATLLAAARTIAERRMAPTLRILVSGKGPMASEVEQAAAELPNVTYLGVVSIERLRAIYGMTDIGLVTCAPSSTVVLPAKFFDYLGAALPMVSSVPGDCRTFVRERGLGVEYDAGDAASLADRLAALANDQIGRRRYADNSREAARDFDREALYQDFLPIIAGAAVTRPTTDRAA
jgi:glycosyltransferase involved in cell wall biosynthesis